MTRPAFAADPKLVTELVIAADHASFAGHFPRFPILPGAVLLDEALYEIGRSRHLDIAQWRVATVKFLEIVRPSDVLTLTHSTPNATTVRFAIQSATRHSEIISGTLSAVKRSDAPGG